MSEPVSDAISEAEVRRWQEEFPALREMVHLANCSHGPQARRVRAAIDSYLGSWLDAGMDWDLWMQEVEAAKAAFADLIGAHPAEVATSTSASAALSSFASALTPGAGRWRVVTSEAEFPTIAHIWLAFGRHGLEADFVPLRDGEVQLEDYAARVDERCLAVSATHVYYENGFKQDLRRIGEIARAAGSLFVVDAYQSLGTCPLNVRDLGIDVLVCGAQKYLLGVPGVAFLYVREELAERFEPTLTGWFGRVDPFAFDPYKLDYADGARRFETGTPPVFAAVAARAGMEIIAEVGVGRIDRHLQDASNHLIERCRSLGLKYAGPTDVLRKGATCAIEVPDPHRVEERLRDHAVIAAARGRVIRLAPHFFTAVDDLDRALDRLRAVLAEDD